MPSCPVTTCGVERKTRAVTRVDAHNKQQLAKRRSKRLEEPQQRRRCINPRPIDAATGGRRRGMAPSLARHCSQFRRNEDARCYMQPVHDATTPRDAREAAEAETVPQLHRLTASSAPMSIVLCTMTICTESKNSSNCASTLLSLLITDVNFGNFTPLTAHRCRTLRIFLASMTLPA